MPRGRRTFGIELMAVAMLVVSVVGFASAFVSTAESLNFEQPLAWRLLIAATSVLGIWAAFEIWRLSPRAEPAYVLWSLIGIVATVYYAIVLAPRMIAIAAEIAGLAEPPRVSRSAWAIGLVVHVGFLVLGWWYLRAALRRGPTG